MSIGPIADLPAPVRELLDGTELAERIGPTLLLVTSGADGTPHLAVLSVGEVLATGGAELRIALRAGSGSTAALLRTGRGLLATVAGGALFRLHLSVVTADEAVMSTGEHVALFAVTVRDVSEDRVPYARLLHGIEFEVPDVRGVLGSWTEKLGLLRRM